MAAKVSALFLFPLLALFSFFSLSVLFSSLLRIVAHERGDDNDDEVQGRGGQKYWHDNKIFHAAVDHDQGQV